MRDTRRSRQLKREASAAALPSEEGSTAALPEEFLKAWHEDYRAENARAVAFVRLLVAGGINSRFTDSGVRAELKRFIAEADKSAGDPAAFIRFFQAIKERVLLSDIVRACYVRLHKQGAVTKRSLRELVKAKCRDIGRSVPNDQDLREVEIAVGLGKLPAKSRGRPKT